ncbi:two-component system sensor histidine kinase CreC [Pseudoduganella sp. GCM10020061]|uniref:two-component system sensor histidine kinase CreC n=1 Tax=Pseudoduganella sp. GCM10020061 TaxID=3317345 RepID=UPI00362CB277
MKIGLRILLGYFLIVGLAAWFLMNVFVEQVKPGVRSTLENTLNDTANLLAVMVSEDVKQGAGNSALLKRMQAYAQRGINARIHDVTKTTLDYRVYMTDARGIVIFDSQGEAVGKDYSRWNDVYLTLRGRYGARSTRSNPDDEMSTVMHVAAPIKDGDRIIGVLTVAKPNATVQPFIERSQRQIRNYGWILLGLSLLIGIVFTLWLVMSLRKLARYAADVEAGKKVALPKLGNNEIGRLGRALDAMRHKLEGKEYVEELMHTLAHELKSPIAAIQASAELLDEDMPAQERHRFLANIREQNMRQRQLIDRLLALVRVEKQQRLAVTERIEVRTLLGRVLEDARPRLDAGGVKVDVEIEDFQVEGDPLMLRQALDNLLDNAIDFSPAGSSVQVAARIYGAGGLIEIADRGPGIPEYAGSRIFERFYSLPRANGVKSTGLGLPFVREVCTLHGGSVEVSNAPGVGARSTVILPRA